MARKRLKDSLPPSLSQPEALGRIQVLKFTLPGALPDRPGAAYGARLRQYREELGLTQQDVERLSGVRRDYVGAVETGRIGVIYPDTFNRLRELYRFPGWEILELMGYRTDAPEAGVHPGIAAILGGLSQEEQERLVELIRAAAALVASKSGAPLRGTLTGPGTAP